MISKDITEKLNQQMNREFSASYLYLSAAAWLKGQSWDGFAHWMEHQSAEEREHAMKIYCYLLDQGAPVELQTIDAPPNTFSSVVEIFERSLKAEEDVSESYRVLMAEVKAAGDSATEIFLQWFITEQVEEEATVGGILERLKRVENDASGLLLMDKELNEAAHK